MEGCAEGRETCGTSGVVCTRKQTIQRLYQTIRKFETSKLRSELEWQSTGDRLERVALPNNRIGALYFGPQTNMPRRLAPWVLMQNPNRNQPTGRLRPISDVRKESLNVYEKQKRLFMSRHKRCQRPGCLKKATDLHHCRGRIGTLLTDERFWKVLCRTCHNWVGDNPTEARRLGLLCEPGEWNTPVK